MCQVQTAKIAQISMRCNFPYFSPDAYLTIRQIDGSIVERQHTLARDVVSEILDGVQRVVWHGERIVLFGDDRHYIGPHQYQPLSVEEEVVSDGRKMVDMRL